MATKWISTNENNAIETSECESMRGLQSRLTLLERFQYRPTNAQSYVDIESAEATISSMTDEEIISLLTRTEDIEEDIIEDKIKVVSVKQAKSDFEKIYNMLQSKKYWTIELYEACKHILIKMP